MKWIVIIIALLLAAVGSWLTYETLVPGEPAGRTLVMIPPRTGADGIAGILAAHGVITNRWPFLALCGVGRLRHQTLKAGEYEFLGPMSPRDIYWKIERGDVYYIAVVVPEGSDRFDIARTLQKQLNIDPAEFLRLSADPDLVHDLDPAAPSLEGYLFPDTYQFTDGTTSEAVVAAMLARFRKVLAHRPLNGGNLHDIVTLASLVEKETPNPDERPMIAGVFQRRLDRHMLLDCDPTAAYAARLELVDAGPELGSPTASQLDSTSPYNTYRHAGLPPGPICSPGAASLDAAMHPAAGTALYFVSNLHGRHVFASTLDEHNRNVARYRHEVARARAEAARP